MKADKMPSREAIAEGRVNKEDYLAFVDIAVAHVVGKHTWNRDFLTKNVTKIATPSDEMFGQVVVLNNWDRAEYWAAQELLNTNKAEIKKNQPLTKWTKEGGSAQIGKGWDDKALLEMVTLSEKIAMDRKSRGKSFDKYYLKEKNRAHGIGTTKRKSVKLVAVAESDSAKKRRTVPDDFEMGALDNDSDGDESSDDDDDESSKVQQTAAC
jgi:hypothetical protein